MVSAIISLQVGNMHPDQLMSLEAYIRGGSWDTDGLHPNREVPIDVEVRFLGHYDHQHADVKIFFEHIASNQGNVIQRQIDLDRHVKKLNEHFAGFVPRACSVQCKLVHQTGACTTSMGRFS